MDSSLIALMILSLFLGCGCWLLFLWAVRDGQFSDIERPKHRMLDDEDFLPSRSGDTDMAVGSSSDPAVRPLPEPPPPDLRAEALPPSPRLRRMNRSAKAGEGVDVG
jgi:cbb3-type cytochrome oxidase maturation protein